MDDITEEEMQDMLAMLVENGTFYQDEQGVYHCLVWENEDSVN